MSQITAIYAINRDNVFGINNRLPWNIKEDLQFFKKTTCESILIMGKNTYLSIKMPLPNRISLVIMSDSNSNSSGGIGIAELLLAIFITLKLCHVIDWSWWWITAPLWLPLVFVIAILGFLVL